MHTWSKGTGNWVQLDSGIVSYWRMHMSGPGGFRYLVSRVPRENIHVRMWYLKVPSRRQLTLRVITEGEAPSFTQRLEVLCLLVSISPAVQHLLGLCETYLTPCLCQVQVKSVSSWDVLLISCPMPQVAVRNSTSGSNSVFWELGKQDTGGMAKHSLPVLAIYKDLAPFLFCA